MSAPAASPKAGARRPARSARETGGPSRRRGAGGAEPAAPVRLGMLEGSIGFALRMAQDASFRAFAQRTGSVGLKPGRFAALIVIGQNPGITSSVLGRAIGRDKSTLTPLIRDLQRAGLVDRRRSDTDRRSAHLSLTRAGQAVLADLVDCAQAHERYLDAITDGAKPELMRLLKQIADQCGS